MFRKLLLLLASLSMLLPGLASAQPLAKAGAPGQLRKVAVQNIEVKTALDEMRLFYASRPDEVNQARGSGYKPFKRMEWFLESRMNDDGTYPAGALWNAFIDKQAARQQLPSTAMMPAGTWTSLGPYGLSNPGFPGAGTNASSGGRMLDFAFDPNDANVIYAAAASGGLWKSPDDGLSWAPLDDKLPVLAVSCVVVDANDANTLYIGTGEGYGNVDAVNGVGVLKSIDGGASWSNTGLSFAYSLGRKVNELIIDPSNSSVLIAATSVGVYRTTDGGTNWTQTLTASPAFDLAIDAGNSNNVFVTVSGTSSTGGIYKSTDNGANWTQLTTANGLPGASTHNRISMDIGTSNSQVLYASFTNTSNGLQGVYKTTDGGSNWALTIATPANYLGSQGWYDNVLAVDPNDEDIVYVGGVQAYKTTDGGANWASVHNNIHVDYHALAFHNGNVYAGNDGGVYKTTDGGANWTNLSLNGLVTHQYYKFGTSFNDANILMGGCQDNGLNQYSGSPDWTKRRGGDGMEVVYDYTDPTSMIVYGENQNGSRLRSTDGGANWTSINTGAPSGPWVTPLEMDPSVPTTLYTIGNTSGGNGDLYKTTDSGSNWSLLFNATEDLGRDVKVAPSNNQVIYVLGPSVVYYSSDGGATFNQGTGLPSTTSLTYVAVDPTNAQIAYITRGAFNTSHVFKTTNGGATWTNITGTLPNIPAITVAIDPLYPSNVYVGTDLGVYLSTDAGATWSDWTDNLPNVVVDELEIHASSRLIRAATHGRGIWSASLFEPPSPPVTANAGSDATICLGASTNLNGTATGGDGSYSFAWTVQSGPNTSSAQFNDATLEDPTFTPTLAGVYVLRFTVDDGVVAPEFDEVQITVNALPTATVSGDATICAGASTTISAALTGTGPWDLTWSDGFVQNSVASSPATRSVSPASNTVYTVTAIADANCTGTSSGSATVTVNPLPTATVSGDATICAGGSTMISAALTGAGPWDLTWSDGFVQNGVTSSPATRIVSPATTTVYTVTAIADANCTGTSSGSATVTVNPLPTVSISGNDPVVTGTTHTYTATTNASSPSYSWSVVNGSINGSSTNSTVSVTAGAVGTMDVNLSVTDGATTCSNSVTKNVTVNPTALMANAGNDASVCLDGAANLDGTASGGSGSYTFAWTVQTGPNTSAAQFSDAAVEDPTFTPTLAGVYVLRFTVDDGVVAPEFDEVQITVNALPTATVSGDATICAGGSTMISAALTGTGPWDLTWSDGFVQNNVASSPATRSVSPASNTVYTVTAIADANCTGTSSGSATVTVNPLPTVTFNPVGPFLVTDAAVDLSSAVSPSGGTFSGPGISGSMFDPSTAGVGTHNVTYSFTDGNGCSNSANRNITVNGVTPPSVKPFVFLGNKVTLKKTKQSTPGGDIHSNGTLTVEKGTPSTYNSNLTAVGKITINKQNTINGNVKSQTSISNSGTITGTTTIGPVPTEALPSLSYSAGGVNKTVPQNGTLTLAPGSYNTVTLNSFSKLKLTSGDYYFTSLKYNSSTTTTAVIEIDLSSGNPITLNVVSNLYLGNEVEIRLLPNGEAGSKLVTFNSKQTTAMTVGRQAYFLGNLNAPNAVVTLDKNSQLRGTICAKEIVVNNDCLFLHHNSSGSLPGPGNLPRPSGNDEETGEQSPVASYELAQNYPNPFNPETQIKFALPEASHVTLAVYSLSGQVVKQLAGGHFAGGQHQVIWDGRDASGAVVAGGIYFCRFTARGEDGEMKFTQTRKMIFVK
jgi:photosystem II stability/assembly factor-like uncharacterized protein